MPSRKKGRAAYAQELARLHACLQDAQRVEAGDVPAPASPDPRPAPSFGHPHNVPLPLRKEASMNETATRILPCPSYDIEAVESWLTDQAKQGWYLERQGRLLRPVPLSEGRAPGTAPTGWYPL